MPVTAYVASGCPGRVRGVEPVGKPGDSGTRLSPLLSSDRALMAIVGLYRQKVALTR